MAVEKYSDSETSTLIEETGAWLKLAALSAWLAIGGVSLLLALSTLQELPLLHSLIAPLQAHVPSEKALYSPIAYFILLSLVFLLERRIPARNQAFFSAGIVQDVLWYVGSMLFRVAFLGFYVLLLADIYRQYLSFLTLEYFSSWSMPARFLLMVVVYDFLNWFSHFIRHKVPLFWKFHAVHHSQEQLNLFTDARVHPVDRIFSATLRFIPLMMLGIEVPMIIAWAIFDTIYPKFYHANVRINFGPLRYIFVTPQSHRVHHACDVAYQDKNFGRMFSIWDRIFGTHYKNDFEYPATGVADPAFPHEKSANPTALAVTFFRQLIYPFQQLFQGR